MSRTCNMEPSVSGTAMPHRRHRRAPAAASGMDALAGGVQALEHTVSGPVLVRVVGVDVAIHLGQLW